MLPVYSRPQGAQAAVILPLLSLIAVAFNPSSMSRVCVRSTNWLGDTVMSLPAIRSIRHIFPHAHIAVIARSWVADLYARESCIDRVLSYSARHGLGAKRELAAHLRQERFDG